MGWARSSADCGADSEVVMAWKWNQTAARYYNTETGRFLSRTKALGFVEESIAAAESVVDTLAGYVAEGFLAPTDFASLAWKEVKDEYIRQYLLGRGGRAQMTQVDWGSVGGSLSEQMRYFRPFMEEVAQGNLSEGQIRSRMRMYINSGREAYERAQAKVAEAAGYDEVLWVLSLGAESCPDCQEFADMGWQKVADDPYDGAIPGSGDTVCLTSCKCHLEWKLSEQETAA